MLFRKTITHRIQQGIKFLDDISPDWHYRVNLKKFDIRFNSTCALGQATGNFNEAQDQFDISDQKAFEMGFLPRCMLYSDWSGWFPWNINKYNRLWKEQILAKREADQCDYALTSLSECPIAEGVET